MDHLIQAIFDGIVDGSRAVVTLKVQEALDAHLDPQTILNHGLVDAMAKVGQLFEDGEYFVPEMLVSARAMQEGLNLLKPHLLAGDIKPMGKVVAGTVKGDLHDIGKNLVCMMLEGAGFTIQDLGADVSPDAFVEAVRQGDVDLVAMSALLTTTMANMKVTIQALEEAGLRGQVKVMIGGAPVTEAYAQQIGADGYAPDASRAVKLAQKLIAA